MVVKKHVVAISFVLLFMLIPGCSIQRFAVGQLTKALSADDAATFTGEDDPQLVRDALPFTMKMYETLLEQEPGNQRLLLITGKLFVLYGYEFVALTADTFTDPKSPECKAVNKRAKKLLLRGRDYVLKGLDLRHPGIMAGIKSGDLNSALAKTTPADTEYLFWAGCAWAAAIGSDRSDLGLAMNANRATALLDKVLQSNENYSNGAVHEIFIPLCAALPLSLGGGEKAARDHFTKAVSCSEGKKAGPYVALATSVALKKNDRKEFTDLLEKALAVDCNSLPEYRLQNTISIERARRLLDHADRLF